jgi:hypothetical protein
MVARFAIALVMGALFAIAPGESPFATAAGARLGTRPAGGLHPAPGAHFGAGRHFLVVRPGGIHPGVGRLVFPIPRLSVPLPHHVIVVGAGPCFGPKSITTNYLVICSRPVRMAGRFPLRSGLTGMTI